MCFLTLVVNLVPVVWSNGKSIKNKWRKCCGSKKAKTTSPTDKSAVKEVKVSPVDELHQNLDLVADSVLVDVNNPALPAVETPVQPQNIPITLNPALSNMIVIDSERRSTPNDLEQIVIS